MGRSGLTLLAGPHDTRMPGCSPGRNCMKASLRRISPCDPDTQHKPQRTSIFVEWRLWMHVIPVLPGPALASVAQPSPGTVRKSRLVHVVAEEWKPNCDVVGSVARG